GNPHLIVAHSRDITEALRTSSQLEETEALLRRYSQEIQLMRREHSQTHADTPMIGVSRSYLSLLELIKKVAVVETTVLI
ncbi:hypothetical protein MXD62_09635, partial [Frankia sp. Mgl5]